MFSIVKQSGPFISSKLMIANDGAILWTYDITLSTFFSWMQTGQIFVPPKYLNKTLFPSITGIPAKAPISPKPRIAVPLVIILP